MLLLQTPSSHAEGAFRAVSRPAESPGHAGSRASGYLVDGAVQYRVDRAVAALAPGSADAVPGLLAQLRDSDYRLRAAVIDHLAALARHRLLGAHEATVVTDLCETVRLGGTTACRSLTALTFLDTKKWSKMIMETVDRASVSGDGALRAVSEGVRRAIMARK